MLAPLLFLLVAAGPQAANLGHGVLVSASGQPLAGVELQLSRAVEPFGYAGYGCNFDRLERHGHPCVTNSAGRFHFDRELEPGVRYSFTWSDGPAAAGVSGWLSDEELYAGARVSAVARRTVTAQLSLPGGSAFAGAVVTLRSSGTTAVADDTGMFTLAAVAEEPEVILIDGPNGRSTWGLLDSRPTEAQARRLVPVRFTLKDTPLVPQDQALQRLLAKELLAARLEQAVETGDSLTIRSRLDDYARVDLQGAIQRLEDGLLADAGRRDFTNFQNCGISNCKDPVLREDVEYASFLRARLEALVAPHRPEAQTAVRALCVDPSKWDPGGKHFSRLATLHSQLSPGPTDRHAWILGVLRSTPSAGQDPKDHGRHLSFALEADSIDVAIAAAVRSFAPDLANALAFSALRTSGCEDAFDFPNNEARWAVATTIDPKRAAAFAEREGGHAMTYVGKALAHQSAR